MKTTIVAEIGSNWEGSITKAKKIVKECKISGADAVKFQMWRGSDLYSKKHPNWNEIIKAELSFSQARQIKKYSDSLGIEFFCSVFYPEAVEFLDSINVKCFKVASRTCLMKDLYSKETLMKKAETKKLIIVSMGMGGNKNTIKRIFSKNPTIFCYCVSEYPLKLSKINWKDAIKFDGFSDHTLGITAPIIFTILKNQMNAKRIIIEKHVKSKNSIGPDASTSIDTDELKIMINQIRFFEKNNFILRKN
ncbi:N-acetylneuraminate synthase family protein [Marine Group I thaumarchaeote]|uniref:N-acetylneuraminate synthase family protein n=1 Tax=Marine Group I thaumarchaeote TaxID=2511932 RepID=A0A7K4MM50_9ARCH|nr:N-acetylneuraminate synthase family protein [Marine Group I thaumarchaeote]